MSAEARALFLGVAVILFGIAAFVTGRREGRNLAVCLIAAGLAVVTIPGFWDAWELATE